MYPTLTSYVNAQINENPHLAHFFFYKEPSSFSDPDLPRPEPLETNEEQPQISTEKSQDNFEAEKEAHLKEIDERFEKLPSVKEMEEHLYTRELSSYSEAIRAQIKILTLFPEVPDESPLIPDSFELQEELENSSKQKDQRIEAAHRAALTALLEAGANLEDSDLLSRETLNAYSFTNWALSRNLCSDPLVRENCQTLYNLKVRPILNDESENSSEINWERKILTYLFNSSIDPDDNETRDRIINLKNTEFIRKADVIETPKSILYYISYFAEEVIRTIGQILNSEAFKLVLSVITAMIIYSVLINIFVTAIILGTYLLAAAIEVMPPEILDIAHLIWEWAIPIAAVSLFGYCLIACCFPSIDQALCMPFCGCLADAICFADSVAACLVEASLESANFTYLISAKIGGTLEWISNEWTDLRLGHEVVEAREYWIDQILAQRAEYREALISL